MSWSLWWQVVALHSLWGSVCLNSVDLWLNWCWLWDHNWLRYYTIQTEIKIINFQQTIWTQKQNIVEITLANNSFMMMMVMVVVWGQVRQVRNISRCSSHKGEGDQEEFLKLTDNLSVNSNSRHFFHQISTQNCTFIVIVLLKTHCTRPFL